MTPDTDIEQIRKELVPKLIRTNTILTVAVVFLVISNIFMGYLAASKKPMTFAVTSTGSVIPMVPMDKPYLGDARIVSFADECVRMAFSHDFRNFRQTVNGAKDCFTSEGSRGFDAAIEPLLDDIEKRRMVMSVSPEPPVVVRKATPRGVHTWIVQTRMTLFRDGTRERISPTTYTVDLVIERVPLEASVRGVGIAQINVRPGNSAS